MNRIIPKLVAIFTIKPKLFKLILNFDAASWCLYYNGKKRFSVPCIAVVAFKIAI